MKEKEKSICPSCGKEFADTDTASHEIPEAAAPSGEFNKNDFCPICGKSLEEWEGNNPYPIEFKRGGELMDWMVCGECERKYVLPLRGIRAAGDDTHVALSENQQ